jgi:hypothetical protein
MSPIDPGFEKALYKIIKKKTGRKVNEIYSAFTASLTTEMGPLPGQAINIICVLSDADLWFLEEYSVVPIPLKHLSPVFPHPYENVYGYRIKAIPDEFVFQYLLDNNKLIRIRPTEATKEIENFAIWLTMLAEQNKFNWWSKN